MPRQHTKDDETHPAQKKDAEDAKDDEFPAIHINRAKDDAHRPTSPLTPTPSPLRKEAGALSTYLAQGRRLAAEVLEGDALGPAIAAIVESRGVWEGTATELLSLIGKTSGHSFISGPKSPRLLSGRLRRLAPALATIGITIDFERAGGFQRHRQIRLSKNRSLGTPSSEAALATQG